MSMVTEHRVGSFSIPQDALDDNPDMIQAVLATVVVVRAEAMFAKRTIDYTAYSDAFEPHPQYEVPPIYDMNVDEEGGVSWTRMAA